MVDKTEKQQREFRVLQEFIERSGLTIVPDSIENRNPPEPDMLCEILNEGFFAFELKEVCDETVAKTVSDLARSQSEECPYLRLGFSLDQFMRRARQNSTKAPFPWN